MVRNNRKIKQLNKKGKKLLRKPFRAKRVQRLHDCVAVEDGKKNGKGQKGKTTEWESYIY